MTNWRVDDDRLASSDHNPDLERWLREHPPSEAALYRFFTAITGRRAQNDPSSQEEGQEQSDTTGKSDAA